MISKQAISEKIENLATLHLVRHGRPLSGSGPRSEWPLDPANTNAVVRLRESDVIPKTAPWYSSPERRAVETAELLTDAEIDVDEALREQDRPDGWWDDFAYTVERGLRVPDEPTATGWETSDSVADRLMSFLSRLPAERAVVLVGHGTAWIILVAVLTGAQPDLTAWRAMRFPDHCALTDGTVVSNWGEWL